MIAVVAAEFWADSRYPALNEKLLMGVDTPLAGLAFNPLLTPTDGAGVSSRILHATINWLYTNRQGMTFGILLGALLMTAMRCIERRAFAGGVANSALGMLLGTPLGVCANCAAPIGQAIHASGGRVETMLAVMVSSPTLNIIVLTMLFALFPPYVVAVKVVLTIGFILIGIPLLTRHLRPARAPALIDMPPVEAASIRVDDTERANLRKVGIDDRLAETWMHAALSVMRFLTLDLWFIIKTTVPLMLLAGLLGAAAVTLVPLEELADLVPPMGRIKTAMAMGAVALLGIFLPVPMSFDVIATAILWHAGLPMKYALILLFTLGISSVFPFFIVWKSIGPRVAVSMSLALAGLGVVAGAAGDRLFRWDFDQRQATFLAEFQGSTGDLRGPKLLQFGGQTLALQSDVDLASRLLQHTMSPAAIQHDADARTSVTQVAFSKPQPAARGASNGVPLFSRHEGKDFGLDEPYGFSVLSFEGPAVAFRGIASGDVHNDGWVDLLLTSSSGISLYANRNGEGFVPQRIDVPGIKEFQVVNSALVDLNNDGWLDIFFSTYRKGNYVIYNARGRFEGDNLVRLPGNQNADMTGAAAFADVDGDGYLDMAIGSRDHPYVFGPNYSKPNISLLRNKNGTFEPISLDVIPGQILSGQTTSILFSDFNNDGKLDLIVGNEDHAPDSFYLGNGKGGFRPITRADGIIPRSTGSTMSIISADIDNDLLPEIYMGQISRPKAGKKITQRDVAPALCEEILDPGHKQYCQEILKAHQGMPSQMRGRDVFKCLSSTSKDYREDCVAYSLLIWARESGRQELCDLFPPAWGEFKHICHRAYGQGITPNTGRPPERRKPVAKSLPGDNSIPSAYLHNIFLKQASSGQFVDRAAEMGVEGAGFTWNAKFADVDCDEYVDLYAVNGWFADPKRESNYFFHNQQGMKFKDMTSEAGLVSFLSTSAYTFIDIDNDGDLDIVSVPISGPVLVYMNNAVKNRIAVELRDHIGNRFGIGSKIIIHYGPGGKLRQLREIQASGGFVSFDAPIAYFGLSDHHGVEKIEVRWSTGERSEVRADFRAGGRYIITRKADG